MLEGPMVTDEDEEDVHLLDEKEDTKQPCTACRCNRSVGHLGLVGRLRRSSAPSLGCNEHWCFGIWNWKNRLCLLFAVGALSAVSLLYYFCYGEANNFGMVLAPAITPRYTIAKWNGSVHRAEQFARSRLKLARMRPKTKDRLYDGKIVPFSRVLNGDAQFDVRRDDVIVFLHIQKTAGTTVERFLTRRLDLERPCDCSDAGRKRCRCFRPAKRSKESWLFSRFSTGWTCGLHADWTELVTSDCVDNALDRKDGKRVKRHYYITTFLRQPIERFISEYEHVVERGATWRRARHICRGRPPTPKELPSCYDPNVGWNDATMDEFLSCPYNLAHNRQTRMLADLTLVNCYDRNAMTPSERARIMLVSAKKNLRDTAFFGLQEDMGRSQDLFEGTFDMRFLGRMDSDDERRTVKSNASAISEELSQKIAMVNQLDIELYRYAKELFNARYEAIFGTEDEI